MSQYFIFHPVPLTAIEIIVLRFLHRRAKAVNVFTEFYKI